MFGDRGEQHNPAEPEELYRQIRDDFYFRQTGLAVPGFTGSLANGAWLPLPKGITLVLVRLAEDWYACNSANATLLSVSFGAGGKRIVSDTGQPALCDDPAGQVTWDMAAVEDGFGGLYIPKGFYCTVWLSPNSPNGAYWLLHGGSACETLTSGSGSGSGTPIKPKRCIAIDQLCPPPPDDNAPEGYEQPHWERQTDGCMMIVSCPLSGSGSGASGTVDFNGYTLPTTCCVAAGAGATAMISGTYTYAATGFNGAGWYDSSGSYQISWGAISGPPQWFGTRAGGTFLLGGTDPSDPFGAYSGGSDGSTGTTVTSGSCAP